MHDTTRLTHSRFRADIDVLRAIAVQAVIGETGDTITFWDCCHLTDAGSRFLMTSIARADRRP